MTYYSRLVDIASSQVGRVGMARVASSVRSFAFVFISATCSSRSDLSGGFSDSGASATGTSRAATVAGEASIGASITRAVASQTRACATSIGRRSILTAAQDSLGSVDVAATGTDAMVSTAYGAVIEYTVSSTRGSSSGSSSGRRRGRVATHVGLVGGKGRAGATSPASCSRG